MKQSVSFLKLKLTNNTLDQHGHVSESSSREHLRPRTIFKLPPSAAPYRSSSTPCTATTLVSTSFRPTTSTASAGVSSRPSPSLRPHSRLSPPTRTPRSFTPLRLSVCSFATTPQVLLASFPSRLSSHLHFPHHRLDHQVEDRPQPLRQGLPRRRDQQEAVSLPRVLQSLWLPMFSSLLWSLHSPQVLQVPQVLHALYVPHGSLVCQVVNVSLHCCRRATKTPAGLDKRAKSSEVVKWESEEDSPAGKTLPPAPPPPRSPSPLT